MTRLLHPDSIFLLLVVPLFAFTVPACKTFRNDGPSPPGQHHYEDGGGTEDAPKQHKPKKDPSFVLEYGGISKLMFIGGVVALFFRHNWGAGCLFAGAVLGPLVGKLTDFFLASAIYIFFFAIAAGLIGAWYLLRRRFNLRDDGTLVSVVKNWLNPKPENTDGTTT